MNYALGLGFILVAPVIAVWGDRTVQRKGGAVLNVFSWSKPRLSLLNLPIAAALAGVGVWFLFKGAA